MRPRRPGPYPNGVSVHVPPSTTTTEPRGTASARSLVSLLGEQRASIVEHLRRHDEATVAELAELLQISEVAVRRHLAVLAGEDLITSEAVGGARGRPAARYRLTRAAGRLFPHRYDHFATEVLDFLDAHHGRDGLLAFLRWRVDREVDGLRDAVTAEDLHTRLQQLADALSDAGFEASVSEEGESFTLVQDHCAIYDVAKDHPEVCAYEAATFSKVLGGDVQLSRRQTLAGGSAACVCTVRPRRPGGGAGSDTGPRNGEDAATSVPNRSEPQ
ncbi:MAG: ArsR family transcriptional regulator [Nitriliruptor sp.]|nr:MAG: ArsR family transcriptional regulator [Nitriliruptor sp.]